MTEEDSRCGYCLQKLDAVEEARVLPCSHVFCLQCLQSDYTNVCPNCKQSFADVAVGELKRFAMTSTEEISEEIMICSSCKTNPAAPATNYCIHCEKALCDKHVKHHDELFDLEHDKVSIETYLSSGFKHAAASKCRKHPNNNLIHGCSVCHLLFCGECDYNKGCYGEWEEGFRANQTAGMASQRFGVDGVALYPTPSSPTGSTGISFGTAPTTSTGFAGFGIGVIPTAVAVGTGNPFGTKLSTAAGSAASTVTTGGTQFGVTPAASAFAFGGFEATVVTTAGVTRFGATAVTTAGVTRFGTTTTTCTSSTGFGATRVITTSLPRHDTGFGVIPTTGTSEARLGFFDFKPDDEAFPFSEGYGARPVATKAPRSKDFVKGLHRFLPIAKFTEKIQRASRRKVAAISSRCTDIIRSEKQTWRLVDRVETHAVRMKRQVDNIIKEQCRLLHDIGSQAKENIDNDVIETTGKAASFVEGLAAECESLMDFESSLNRRLQAGVECEELVEAVNEVAPAVRKVIQQQIPEFSLQKQSVDFVSGVLPTIRLKPYIPSGIEFIASVNTSRAVAILCTMSDGDVLVGTAKNSIQLRDCGLNILATKQLENQLLDIATVESNILTLEQMGLLASVNVYSKGFVHLRRLRNYNNGGVPIGRHGKVSLSSLGSNRTLMLQLSANELRYFSDGALTARSITLAKAPRSACVSNGRVYYCHPGGITFMKTSNTAKSVQYQWKHGKKRESSSYPHPTFQIFPSGEACQVSTTTKDGSNLLPTMPCGVISKTPDPEGYLYAYYENRIAAFRKDEKASGFTHPKLTEKLGVSAIAVFEDRLLLGCEDGEIMLFKIL